MSFDKEKYKQEWASDSLNDIVHQRREVEWRDYGDGIAARTYKRAELAALDELINEHVAEWLNLYAAGLDLDGLLDARSRLANDWDTRPAYETGRVVPHRLEDPRAVALNKRIDAAIAAHEQELEELDVDTLKDRLIGLYDEMGDVPRHQWARGPSKRVTLIEEALSNAIGSWSYELRYATIDDLETEWNALTGDTRSGPVIEANKRQVNLLGEVIAEHPVTRFRRWAPARFADAALSEDHDQVAEWVAIDNEIRGNLALLGPVGCGKTYAAYAAFHALARRHGWRCHTLKGRLLLDDIANANTIGGGTVIDLLERLRPDGDLTIEHLLAPRILFLDDVGAERHTEWAAQALYQVIDGRWRDGKPIVWTSNLAPSNLKDVVGDRLYDRLRDGATTVTFKGRSRRAPRRPVQAVS